MLKGEAKTAYMREYMRRRRAGSKPAQPKPGRERTAKPSAAATIDALQKELAAAKARFAELEVQLARRDAALARERSAPAEEAAVEVGGEPMGKRVFKLVLRLDSPNDNEALLAVRKLVRALKANGSDVRTLAAGMEAEWEKQQKAKRPIDFSEVETAVKRYATDRTTVKYKAMWEALVAEVPALVNHRGKDVTVYIHRCLRHLGFAGSSSGLTWHRT
jgi:hypothetical protein